MKIEACAKINYTLEVYGTRPDGYHALRSVVVPVSLSDTLEFAPAERDSTDTGYPDDLILKAVRVLRTAANRAAGGVSVHVANRAAGGVSVHVAKRIPSGGGLGGGSADAAATLIALNGMWGVGMPLEALATLGASVGSDVPALVLANVLRKPVLMEGRGEIVAPCDRPKGCGEFIVLANPGVHTSTPSVYARCAARTVPAAEPVNDLQAPAVALHSEIGAALAKLAAAGATGVRMTGSGSTVFGFAPTAAAAAGIAAALTAAGLWAKAGRTYG